MGDGYCLQQGAGGVFGEKYNQEARTRSQDKFTIVRVGSKNHDSPAAGGYIAASKTRAAGGL